MGGGTDEPPYLMLGDDDNITVGLTASIYTQAGCRFLTKPFNNHTD